MLLLLFLLPPIAMCISTTRPPAADVGTTTTKAVVNGILCKVNTTFVMCSGCEPKCGETGPRPCPAICGPPTCQCSTGYVRDTDGRCVLPQDCSNPEKKCAKNEVYRECRGCEGTCANRNPICSLVCRPAGCECPLSNGFVRDTKGNCIPLSQCPQIWRCAKNEVYRRCRTCEGTCENPNPRCPRICRPPGCECPLYLGFVRDNRRNCIPKSDCPPTCNGVRCPSGQHCVLRPVVCIRAPCHPQPTCVNDDREG